MLWFRSILRWGFLRVNFGARSIPQVVLLVRMNVPIRCARELRGCSPILGLAHSSMGCTKHAPFLLFRETLNVLGRFDICSFLPSFRPYSPAQCFKRRSAFCYLSGLLELFRETNARLRCNIRILGSKSCVRVSRRLRPYDCCFLDYSALQWAYRGTTSVRASSRLCTRSERSHDTEARAFVIELGCCRIVSSPNHDVAEHKILYTSPRLTS